MSDYNVQQISKMLKINPETVRRWIRTGKLKAVQSSRKNGNLVSEDSLKAFLKETPKYSNLIGTLFTPPAFAIPIAVGGLIASIMATFYEQKSPSITPEYIEKYLRKEIEKSSHSIETKKKTIYQLQEEITVDEKRMEKYKYALEKMDLKAIADEINKSIK